MIPTQEHPDPEHELQREELYKSHLFAFFFWCLFCSLALLCALAGWFRRWKMIRQEIRAQQSTKPKNNTP